MRGIVVLLLLLYVAAYPRSRDALEQSDSLFSAGVELYRSGKYAEAIPLFAESDRIDKAELDSASNRRVYSSMWLAHCYKNLGKPEKADSIYSPLEGTPVDRRLTVVSDSLSDVAGRMRPSAAKISLLERVAALEAENLGETHQWRANTLAEMAMSQVECGDFEGAERTFGELYRIASLNDSLRFNSATLTYLFGSIFPKIDDPGSYNTAVDRMIYLATLCRPDKYDILWSLLIRNKVNLLQDAGKVADAEYLVEKAYGDVVKAGVDNANLFEISSLMGTICARRFMQSRDSLERDSLDRKRTGIYDSMLSLSRKLWGDDSYEYGSVVYKIANTYLGLGKRMDREKGGELLVRAFDLITDSINMFLHAYDVVRITENAANQFDIADIEDFYLSYAQKVIGFIEKEYEPGLIDLAGLKEAVAGTLYTSIEPEKRQQAIAIYTDLIKDCDNPRKMVRYMKSRALCYGFLKDYQASLNDYLSLDSIYGQPLPAANFLDESSAIDVKKEISGIYLMLGDTVNYLKYRQIYCQLSESLIGRIVSGEVEPLGTPYDDDYKLGIVKDYADYFISLRYSDWNTEKAVEYYELYLDLLSKLNPVVMPRWELRAQVCSYLARIYIFRYDFDNAYRYASEIVGWAEETGDISYRIRGLDLLSDLYERVSIEPELSLGYKLQSCELQSEELVNNRNSMLKEEYITGYDMILQEWHKCAELYRYLGDEKGVDHCYGQLLHYIGILEGRQSGNYAGSMYEWLNNYKIPLHIWEKHEPEKAVEYCDSLVSFYKSNRDLLADKPYFNFASIGLLYCYAGDKEKASECYGLYEQELKQKYPDDYETREEYIELLENKAILLEGEQKIGALKAIESMYAKSGENRDGYLSLLGALMSEYSSAGNKEAEIECCRKILELSPGDVLTSLVMVSCYKDMGLYEEIVPMFDMVSEGTRAMLLDDFKSQPAEYRESRWWRYEETPFTLGEPLAEMFGDCVSPATVYNNLLMRKNFLLNASISAENLIKTEGDSLLLAKYGRMLALKDFLDTDKDSIENKGHTISREQAGNLVKRFNQEIMKRAAILGDYTASLFVDWQAVQSKLNADEVAVEFSRYRSFSGETVYGAVVLLQSGGPVFKPLFKENDLKNIQPGLYYSSSGLYDLVWRPLEEFFEGKTTVYFSPDGMLYNIGIENIPCGDGLISDKYDIYRLSSTRELTRVGGTRGLTAAAVYGGLRYDTDTEVLISDSKKYHNRSMYSGSFIVADSLNLRGGVKYLPATKNEAIEIGGRLSEINAKPELFTDTVGTEASFKNLSGRHLDLLHVATHGFYWTAAEAAKFDKLPFLSVATGDGFYNFEDKALTRSGLLMAGANNALTGKKLPEGVDDGILTAKEISRLDLRGLDLVVLSACQTGLGEISGDGVFGLQRGFKKAGANTLLMSLWNVDDNATRLLMIRFYSNYIAGKNKFEALREAQRYVRDYEVEIEVKESAGKRPLSAMAKEQARKRMAGKSLKKVRPYQSPEYWAAFILLDAVD